MIRLHPPSAVRHPPSRRPRRPRGFTLIETALTTVIVGTGVLAIVAAQQAYVQKNDWAQRTGLGMMLANELREMALTLPMYDPIYGPRVQSGHAAKSNLDAFNCLEDFANRTFSPPINAMRQTVNDLPGWSQHIEVVNVLPDNISSTFTQPLGTTDVMRLTVTVSYQSPQMTEPMAITQMTWVTTR